MKKLTLAILSALVLFSFCACRNGYGKSSDLKIIATVFPAYDFARAVAGDAAEVRMMLPPGSESHSYEPTASDLIDISSCDLFIYTGGESDEWVDNILSSIDKKVNTLKMIDLAPLIPEEEDEHEHEHEQKYDEHVWTSPKNAERICNAIAEKLVLLDPENADVYAGNRDRYVGEIDALDEDFSNFFAGVENKTLVFGDRFPFLHFVNAYGLDYVSVFPGCGSNTEPSMAVVAAVIDKIKTENIPVVFYIEFSNHKTADAIAEATGAKTALFHSCHNVSKEELEAGATYVSIMRNNLETLKGCMK